MEGDRSIGADQHQHDIITSFGLYGTLDACKDTVDSLL